MMKMENEMREKDEFKRKKKLKDKNEKCPVTPILVTPLLVVRVTILTTSFKVKIIFQSLIFLFIRVNCGVVKLQSTKLMVITC